MVGFVVVVAGFVLIMLMMSMCVPKLRLGQLAVPCKVLIHLHRK